MAQFKFIGHSNGAAPDHDVSTTVSIRGKCKMFGAESFEMDVMPDEVFEVPDDWETAIASLSGTQRNGQPCYEKPRREKDAASRIAEIERDIVNQDADLHVDESDVVPTNGASPAIVKQEAAADVEPEFSEETLSEIDRLSVKVAELQSITEEMDKEFQAHVVELQEQLNKKEQEVVEAKGQVQAN